MESLSNARKRKKRKTRKCLDEIRKRSRRNVNDSLIKLSPMISKINKKDNFVDSKANVCITSKRLTLSMFPKVIRSETVTRPVLPDINKDSGIDFERIVKNSMFTKTQDADSLNTLQQSNSDSDHVTKSDENCISGAWTRYSGMEQMSMQKDSDSGNLSTQDNSPGSFLLFSPVNQTEDSDLFEVSANETLSTSSTPSSQGSAGVYGYHLYEEFMNEIPFYLKQNTPALIKDDVMKKTKAYLHNIYLEGCRQECETNIMHCMRSGVVKDKCTTPKESLIQSPVDFLQASPMAPACPQPAPSRSALYDTPDYTYYPHKLNQ